MDKFGQPDGPNGGGPNTPPLSSRLVAGIILISLVFGAFGGVAGALYFARQPSIAKLSTLQQGVYKESSSIIDVVNQASPAVVSVVISQDISKIPGLGSNPFSGNGFFSPFFGQSGQQPQAQPPAAPNIQKVGAGSGFFVTSDGLVLTNKHVASIEQASYTVVTADGKSYPATVAARDPVNDLAILKVDIKNAPTLPLADSNTIQIGEQVVAIGDSLGQYENTVTHGIVSGIARSITAGGPDGSEQLEGVIQTDAAINPGNSGGPLLNLAGQVIGMNTAVDQQGQLLGFALPANLAKSALASYQKSGKISRPFLGIRYVTITQAIADQEKLARNYGALVIHGQNQADAAVLPGSPADKAGLQENDIILEVNGNQINEKNTLSRQLQQFNPGDKASLKIFHAGSEKTISLTLGEAK